MDTVYSDLYDGDIHEYFEDFARIISMKSDTTNKVVMEFLDNIRGLSTVK